MESVSKFIKITFISIFSILTVLYLFFLFLLPPIINSVKLNSFVGEKIYEATGIEAKSTGLILKTYKDLSITISLGEIFLEDKDEKILSANNIYTKINLLKKEIQNIDVDYIFINQKGISKLIKKDEKKKKKAFSLKSIPQTKIKQAEFIINDETNISQITIKDLFTEKEELQDFISFESNINSTYLENDIKITSQKNIAFDNKKITIKSLDINFFNSILTLNGNISLDLTDYEFKLTGENLPINDIEQTVLHILKLRKKGKNFLENFINFKGTTDLNLKINKDGIFGTGLMKKLGATFTMFNVPIDLSDFKVNFIGKKIYAEAHGLIGREKVYTNFRMSEFSADKREIEGRVFSSLSDEFTKQYMPDFSIIGRVDANIIYNIKNSTPKISYLVKIPKESNLYYKNASLELTDKTRRVLVRTKKENAKLYITHYDYSIQEKNNIINLLLGDALVEKINNKMTLQYINCKTKSDTPISIIGSFGKNLDGGTFNGNLKYDNNKKNIIGNFEVKDTKYKDFIVHSATINGTETIMDITATGTFDEAPYSAQINLNNKFDKKVIINNIDLFLEQFEIKDREKKKKNKKITKNTPEDFEFTIKNGHIKLNKIFKDKIIVENIELFGSLNNNIALFTIPAAKFAKGILTASGQYNINEHASEIDFKAQNIDSNKVATMVFNLPNQIEGIASANLHATTKHNLKYVKAHANFAINDGYLPKLGSTEFIIKRSKKNKKPLKIRLSDIINIDISKAKALSSDLKGSFDLTNYKIDNVEIYSKQKYLSLFIEGNYNLRNENANLQLWGNYNKTAQSKVRILFVPLSLITKILFKPEHTKHLYTKKINKIPQISATKEEIETFTVSVTGNLNKNNIKVNLKSIK